MTSGEVGELDFPALLVSKRLSVFDDGVLAFAAPDDVPATTVRDDLISSAD
jgi:hypothetical protein